MYNKFKRPTDTPASACGHCYWWHQTDSEGWGRCTLSLEKNWYKHAVCEEYEFDQ